MSSASVSLDDLPWTAVKTSSEEERELDLGEWQWKGVRQRARLTRQVEAWVVDCDARDIEVVNK